MSTKAQYELRVGDDVVERPRGNTIVAVRKGAVPEYASKSRPRFGVVKDLIFKTNARGQKIRYCLVLWDYQQTPSWHAHSRLQLRSEWDSIVADAQASLKA